MTDTAPESPPESIASRMARLQLSQVGVNNPGAPRPPPAQRSPTSNGVPKGPAPPPPARPPRPKNIRGRTVSLPVKEPLEHAAEETHHDKPDEVPTPVTGITFKSKPTVPPRLPPRRPSLNSQHSGDRDGPGFRLPPPPLPSNSSARSKSPSGSSTFSITSHDTIDTVATDDSTAPKLPPRLPNRTSNPPPLPSKRPPPKNRKSSDASKDGPRNLPPVNDVLPELKPWKQPEREAVLPKTATFTDNVKKKVGMGSKAPTKPPLPNRRPSASGSIGNNKSSVLPPPTPTTPTTPTTPPRHAGRPPVPSSSKKPPSPPSVNRGNSRKLPPPGAPSRSILEMGFGGSKGRLPSPERPKTEPPPIPLASRPSINLATKPTTHRANSDSPPVVPCHPSVDSSVSSSTSQAVCLKCRDFSAADHHASLFPRQNNNDVRQLAIDLTSPFDNITDKARAMFTWMHHNIAYDTVSFFSNNVKSSTPASTLNSGLAVCEGYAGLLAAMALHVGIEAIVVSGHGKGYGYTPISDGRAPPFSAGHAWNAVRLDHGWHVIDACWGAGNVSNGGYEAKFKPEFFTQTPTQFRRKHFPSNIQYQYCADIMTWEEYILMDDGPLIYGTFTEPDVDFSPYTLEPSHKVLTPDTKYWFRLSRSCEHQNKSPWIVLLNIDGKRTLMRDDGRGNLVAEGVAPCAGKDVSLMNLTTFNNNPAKGLSIEEYEAKVGRVGMSWSGLCKWTVA